MNTKMPVFVKHSWSLTKESLSQFISDECPRRGAALAYYSIFSISPLFLVILAVASLWFGQEGAQSSLFSQVASVMGPDAAKAIKSLATLPQEPARTLWSAVAAFFTILLGATIVFGELQSSLNAIWKVQPKPGHGFFTLILHRVMSFAMLLVIGFLLIVSLVITALLAVVGQWIGGHMPFIAPAMTIVDFVISFGTITVLFAMIYKVLPDVKMAWRDVFVGSLITSLLFNLGKTLIGIYLGHSKVATSYGAAGSMIVALVWIYYSAQIFFLGAEFTAIYANKFGSRIKPIAQAELTGEKTIKEAA